MSTTPKKRSRFWAGKSVLVTGATGVIGSWLIKELLDRGALVTALVYDADPQSEFYRSGDFKSASVVEGALQDFRAVERAVNERETEAVFHLGAQTIVGTARRSPLPTFEANIRGTYNLLEACRLHPDVVRRVLIASSDKAYGEKKALPYTEDMRLDGSYPYEVSKSCADLLAGSYHRSYGLPVAIARCGNVYGGGDLNWSRIVPGTIRSQLRGERPVIRSDGKSKRDYIYVKDVARAYLRLAEALDDKRVRGEAFNFSAETPRTVLDVVKVLQRLTDTKDLKPAIKDTATGEIRHQHLSCKKARKLLGWRPDYGMEDGLGETVDWYRAFLGAEGGL